jgi:hypothetical protein
VDSALLAIRWLTEAALLAAGLAYLAKRLRDGRLLLLTMGSFGLRCGVGMALYFISVLGLPVMRHLPRRRMLRHRG